MFKGIQASWYAGGKVTSNDVEWLLDEVAFLTAYKKQAQKHIDNLMITVETLQEEINRLRGESPN